MARQRLTSRTAEDLKAKPGTQVEAKGSGIDNDPYDMNDTGHEKNDPKVDEYAKGDPSAWAEDPNMADPAKDDSKREETGHAPLIDKHAAMEAIASAKRLEEKAIKCIVAAERMLPGADQDMIKKQAADLLSLPEDALNSTLTRQEELAKTIAKAAAESAEESGEKEMTPEEKEKAEKATAEKKLKEEKLLALKKEAAELEAELTGSKEAGADQNDPEYGYSGKEKKDDWRTGKKAEDENDNEEEMKKEKKPEEEEKKEEAEESEEKEAAKEEKSEEEEEKKEEKEASDDLLSQIFNDNLTTTQNKKGASTLSGMVKKEASSQMPDNLSNLWASAPNVSGIF